MLHQPMRFIVPSTLSFLSLVVAVFHNELFALLQYQNSFSDTGEYWRVVTAHFTHLDTLHLMVNLLGLWLIWLLVGSVFSNLQWLYLIIVLSLSVSFSLKFFSTDIYWYVGFSGVQYGLLVAALIVNTKKLASLNTILLALVFLKVAADVFGFNLTLMSISGKVVVVEAHLYGTIAGVIIGIFFQIQMSRNVAEQSISST